MTELAEEHGFQRNECSLQLIPSVRKEAGRLLKSSQG